jgi:hypothetical protein
MVDVDLFDQASLIPNLKSQGHSVICYFSAGSWESWRPDASDPNWEYIKIGKMGDWDEIWLDVRNMTALEIVMGNRLDLAQVPVHQHNIGKARTGFTPQCHTDNTATKLSHPSPLNSFLFLQGAFQFLFL